MSDILGRAEAIQQNAKSEWAVRSVQAAETLDLLPGLIAEIKRLNRIIQQKDRDISYLRSFDERRVPFNRLEIVVRPQRMEFLDTWTCDIDLRAVGSPDVPDRIVMKRISLTALDLLQMDKDEFVKEIGAIMAAELLR